MDQESTTLNQSVSTGVSLPLVAPDDITALPKPTFTQKLALNGQKWIGRLLLLPFAGLIALLFKHVGKYRIENMKELRAQFRELSKDKSPTMICLNHLTFVDSALLIWAFAPNWWYLFNYRCFSWNLPAGDFFKKKFRYRVVAFLSKCIFIHRDGSREHKNAILGACHYLLKRGEMVSIFPEGKRSRLGRFNKEQLTFGVGKILAQLENPRVICAYIRADKQEGFSNYPPLGSTFRVSLEVIRPSVTTSGRMAYREIVAQIANSIERQEHEYFRCRQ